MPSGWAKAALAVREAPALGVQLPLSQATKPRANGQGEVLPLRSPDLLCTSEGCVAEGI